CAICLAEYRGADALRCLPCGHAGHVACLDKWLAINASCPECRAGLTRAAVAAGGGGGAVADDGGALL
ncbi:hypothetical protein JKP88DRAFT_187564, partial [Tribonema minus]